MPRYAFIAGVATSIAAGISMAYSEGLSDTGELTGRGSPLVRGLITGAGTFLGGILHTLPFLIPHYELSLASLPSSSRFELVGLPGCAGAPRDELPALRGATSPVGGLVIVAVSVALGAAGKPGLLAQQVVDGLARSDQARVSPLTSTAAGRGHRCNWSSWPGCTRRWRALQEVTALRGRERDVVDEDVAGLAVHACNARPPHGVRLVCTRGAERRVAGVVELGPGVVGHAPVDRDPGAVLQPFDAPTR